MPTCRSSGARETLVIEYYKYPAPLALRSENTDSNYLLFAQSSFNWLGYNARYRSRYRFELDSPSIDIQFGRLTPMPNCCVAAGMSLIGRFNAGTGILRRVSGD